MGKKYYCSKCEQFHYRGNVYNEHKDYQIDPPEEENGKNVSGKNSESSSSKVSTGTLNAPSNSLTPLRNINISGGLFTENILLRLRDTPKQLEIGQIKSFIDEDTNIKRKQFKDKRREIFEWCIEKWDEISPNIDKWSKDELQEKWIIPFFTQFGHDLEPFEMKEVNKDEEYSFGNFTINFQSKNHKDPFFHIVDVKEDFEMKIDSNPNNSSHHKICQQFINFNSEIKWLFLTNGRILRLLTKYYHTYSKGYIEFDLENIFSNRDVKEFEAMFAIVHKSRFITKPGDHKFVIDEFQKEAVKEGVKVGDSLRDNVHNALELLGNELIQQNPRFLDLVMSEGIDLMEYYAELLRIIYRIIFILYAEQREMLPGAGSIYFEEFSLSSLRILAEKPIKAEKNYDLWKKLFLTFKLVGKGNNFLGINSYDGELFDNDNLDLILNNEIKISNDNLLKIIRLLTTTESNNVRQRINFLEIREEEIGAIYESLLDFKPYIDEISQFQLVAGTERKSTGSYYTPKELIDILIRTTLQPLVEDRLKDAKNYGKNFENAILDIKVCDPACGGGTFLLAALDFLGKKFAQIRTNSDSPSEIELRSARRKVLQYCIYGVDMNPLAVELAKISLWLRATVRDKPLNFLDNHIKCGNSLIGFGKKQKIKKIKPKAFKAIKGNKSTGISPEDKREQNNAREIIKNEIKEREKKGKTVMITSYLTTEKTADICSTKFQEIIELPEDDSRKIEEKEEKYEKLRKDARYQLALKEANIWTSTFFWSFEGKGLGEIPRYTTIEQSRKNVKDPELNKLIDRINEIAENNQIFHWYVEFPEVFSSERKGFDCILTNPPWETLQLKEMEFFTGLNNKILKAPNQSERRKLIKDLKNENYKLFQKYKNAWQAIKKMSHFLKKSGLFDLSAQGTINTYALFVERCWRLISPNGYTGIICPTGIIMNYYMQDLFRTFVKNKSILSMFDFENRKKLFEIDSRYRFCLLTLGGKNVSREIIPMTFYTYDSIEIQESLSIVFKATQDLKEKIKELSENHILIPLKQEDFRLFNPNTITCPSFRTIKDYQLLKNVYKNSKIIINKDIESNNVISNPWDIKFYSMFH
ncbi:MAG: N-6 DNA methylase, partial [Candidatus Lokiarchaeota archaeon]